MELGKKFTLIRNDGILQGIKGSRVLYSQLNMGYSKLWENTNNYRAEEEEDSEED